MQILKVMWQLSSVIRFQIFKVISDEQNLTCLMFDIFNQMFICCLKSIFLCSPIIFSFVEYLFFLAPDCYKKSFLFRIIVRIFYNATQNLSSLKMHSFTFLSSSTKIIIPPHPISSLFPWDNIPYKSFFSPNDSYNLSLSFVHLLNCKTTMWPCSTEKPPAYA